MVRWTRCVVSHRRLVLATWVAVLLLGAWATSDVGRLLTNRFSVPGSDAEKGLTVLKERFHERGDGAFTLVVQSRVGAASPAAAEAAAQRAAAQVPQGKAGPPRVAGPGVAYVQIQTPLEAADAKNYTERMR